MEKKKKAYFPLLAKKTNNLTVIREFQETTAYLFLNTKREIFFSRYSLKNRFTPPLLRKMSFDSISCQKQRRKSLKIFASPKVTEHMEDELSQPSLSCVLQPRENVHLSKKDWGSEQDFPKKEIKWRKKKHNQSFGLSFMKKVWRRSKILESI